MQHALLTLPKRLVRTLAKVFTIGLLLLAALLFAAPLFAETWPDPTTGIQWKYSLWRDSFDDSDKATIEGASNAFGSLAIPSTINSHRVTTIEDGTFADCTSLTSVTIPDSVTKIEDGAFADCTSLTSVTIPESVTEIESYTFSDCTCLTSVTIPNGVTVIGWGAFEGCTSLTSVTIPDSVTTIRDSAFLGCTSLTSVTIPDSVTTIGYDAFKGCTNLRHAYIIFNKARNIAPTAFEDSTTKIVLWPLAEILS